MKNWMKTLATHYQNIRNRYPDDTVMILFDVDGTILDTRFVMLHALKTYDQEHGTAFFADLTVDDIRVHEHQAEELLASRGLPAEQRQKVLDWYQRHRWSSTAILGSHQPFRGVMEVIRWFQIQPETVVGLNTGKPESVRGDTLRALNQIGKEFKVVFDDTLLRMNPYGWDTRVEEAKAEAVRHFRQQGFRVFAFVDHDPRNLEAVARIDPEKEVLLLHADVFRESRPERLPVGWVSGETYDLTELVQERALPRHIQFVWHGVNDEANLRQFLASNVQWAEFDVRSDATGENLILRHDSFTESPLQEDEEVLVLDDTLDRMENAGKSVKLDLKEGGDVLDRVLDLLGAREWDDSRLWFNASVQALGEEGFRKLAGARPAAVLQCPIDFLVPLAVSAPDNAREVLEVVQSWGLNRFSVSWKTPRLKELLDRAEEWGYEINVYNVPDLESFLKAVLLLPRSITSDFNFPKWHYFGRGSGHNQRRYEYVMK